MKKWLAVIVLVLGMSSSVLASSADPSLPADEALQLLKQGNTRYATGQALHGHQDAERRAGVAKSGQRPVATILGCSDSRAPLEVIFDQGLGDIFVVRVAGNTAGPDALASVEYGVGQLGTPVVLVLGHTACDVVSAAVQNVKPHGSLAVASQIRPAVAKAKTWNPTSSGDDLLNKSIKANVWLSMETILRKSLVVRESVKNGSALLVGGVYDLATGQVAWLGQHPEQGKILAAAQVVARPKPKPKPRVENPAEAKAEDAAEDKPQEMLGEKSEAKSEPKPAAKPAAKAGGKPAAKPDAKSAAKSDAKSDATPIVRPDATSEGAGELLAPMLDKVDAKPAAKPAAKSAHP